MQFAEYRLTRRGSIVGIIAAGRETTRIRVSLEYLSNEGLHIRCGLGPELQEPFVNCLTHYVGKTDPVLAKGPRFTETLGIESYVD